MIKVFIKTLALVIFLGSSLVASEHFRKAAELCAILTPIEDISEELSDGFGYYLSGLYSSGVEDIVIAQLRDVFEEFIQKIIADPELMPKLTAVYARLFSEKELDEILCFYKTPAGKKILNLNQELYTEASAIGEDIALKYQSWLEREIERITD